MMTVEHLLQMCQGGGNGSGGGGGSGGLDLHPDPPFLDEATMDPSQRIQQVPFSVDLIHLLPMCQQAELLVSTYIQGKFGMVKDSVMSEFPPLIVYYFSTFTSFSWTTMCSTVFIPFHKPAT